ncbi:MAG: FixG Ig-like domain-containing protein, partial [Pseudomonadota bacterium]
DTLIVAYDETRGEPRGSRRRGVDPESLGLGSCVDCNVCVQVCPTGIDIRDGLQYQCIACSACIDACDDIMDKMSYPRGLIRYTTENSVQGKLTRMIRPRIVVYALLLMILTGLLVTHVSHRIPLDLDVIRDRNSLYRETREGLIENVYTLKILNMDKHSHQYQLTAAGIAGLKLMIDQQPVVVEGGQVHQVVARIQADEFNLEARSVPVYFHLQAVDANHLVKTEEARFVGPGN